MATVTPKYTPGERITVKADGAALVGGRFVMLAATKPDDSPLPVKKPTGATVPILGVVGSDCAQNEHTTLFTHGHVVPVEVGSGGVTAGNLVKVDTNGCAVAHDSTNVKAGIALQTKAQGEYALCMIHLAL